MARYMPALMLCIIYLHFEFYDNFVSLKHVYWKQKKNLTITKTNQHWAEKPGNILSLDWKAHARAILCSNYDFSMNFEATWIA